MGSVYRAPLSTGRVGKKHLSSDAFANTVRGHVCSVHTTHVYVPYRWAMFSSRVVWTGAREHGLRTRVSKMTHVGHPCSQPVNTGSVYQLQLQWHQLIIIKSMKNVLLQHLRNHQLSALMLLARQRKFWKFYSSK